MSGHFDILEDTEAFEPYNLHPYAQRTAARGCPYASTTDSTIGHLKQG